LEIETKRHVGAPMDQRTCKLCHTAVGDEAHFMLACPVLHLDRLLLFTYMSHTVSSFEHLSVAEQMCAIMEEAKKSISDNMFSIIFKLYTLVQQPLKP